MALELPRIQSWWDIINGSADIMTGKNDYIYQMKMKIPLKHDYILAFSSIRCNLCFFIIVLCEGKKFFLELFYASWLPRQSPTSESFLFLSALLFTARNIFNYFFKIHRRYFFSGPGIFCFGFFLFGRSTIHR